MAAARFGALVYVLLFALAALWGSALIVEDPIRGLFVDHWYGFYLGALSYWALSSKQSLRAFYALLLIVLVPALVAGETFRITCALTAGLLFLAGRTGALSTALNGRILQFLGRISYSLYLTHTPITGASFFVWRKLAGSGTLPELAGLLFTFLACVAAAAIFWFALERTSLKLAHRIGRSR
jgi:peptidoglycan/LPS O-acetylase OafA/YrhL